MKVGEGAIFDDRVRRETSDRVIALTAREFVEEMGGIFPRHRQLDGDQQFVRRQRGLIDTPEEILGRNSPLACLAACDNDRAERGHKRKPRLSSASPSPSRISTYFSGIRRWSPPKVKFVYRTIISDLRLLDLSCEHERRTVCSDLERTLRERGDESGFLHDADPSA